jgi:hypothetical protein
MPRCGTTLEDLDDGHAAAAAWTRMREWLVVVGKIGGLILWL